MTVDTARLLTITQGDAGLWHGTHPDWPGVLVSGTTWQEVHLAFWPTAAQVMRAALKAAEAARDKAEAERDRQYDENVNRIHKEALAEARAERAEVEVARLKDALHKAKAELAQMVQHGFRLTKRT